MAALTDDLLAAIFLRLPAPADLLRASAVCAAFRRLVTARSFLRRFRSLHAAPFLGFVDRDAFHRALPPHPSAPAARAVSLAGDFSFSFLPTPRDGRWTVLDVRDGRFLLDLGRAPEEEDEYADEEYPAAFTDLAVCDPLQRRFLLLPRIPDTLAAVSVDHPFHVQFGCLCEPFLVPSGGDDDEDEEETSFTVIRIAHSETNLLALVFSSRTGQWRAVASQAWSDLLRGSGVSMGVIFSRQYACNCFYWMVGSTENLLVFDTRRMEFSVACLPPGCYGQNHIAIVDAGESRPGLFSVREHVRDEAVDLCYTVRSSNQWQMEKTIPLDSGYRYYIRGATERYLLLVRCRREMNLRSLLDTRHFEWFSLDFKTLQLENVCVLKHGSLRAHIYTNFPPSLSSPTV